MNSTQYIPAYHRKTVTANGLGDFAINYVEAGSPESPTLLLLHGYPSSSTQFRDFIPLVSHKYHVLAPDLPGFGLTTSPESMRYTFDNLTAAIRAWLDALKVTSYAIYIFDYGAPVGLRLALQQPEQVKAIISQNGNAYIEGFGKSFWEPVENLWNSANSTEAREFLRNNFITLEGTKFQYEM